MLCVVSSAQKKVDCSVVEMIVVQTVVHTVVSSAQKKVDCSVEIWLCR